MGRLGRDSGSVQPRARRGPLTRFSYSIHHLLERLSVREGASTAQGRSSGLKEAALLRSGAQWSVASRWASPRCAFPSGKELPQVGQHLFIVSEHDRVQLELFPHSFAGDVLVDIGRDAELPTKHLGNKRS